MFVTLCYIYSQWPHRSLASSPRVMEDEVIRFTASGLVITVSRVWNEDEDPKMIKRGLFNKNDFFVLSKP